MFSYEQSVILFTLANVGVINIVEGKRSFHEAHDGQYSSTVYIGEETISRVSKRDKLCQAKAALCILLHEAGHSKARFSGLNRANEILAWELGWEIREKHPDLFPISKEEYSRARESALASYKKRQPENYEQWEKEIIPKPKLIGPPRR